ncbi:NAD/FAD-utilizing enzyme [Teredinibacter sp. KSP-S5-2]|uniref:NAD/FAD-utilizing enzyme n=1 Tax=Teredinibacter sp. KSP-S5-2 TaxID=3034506 RepID=UPI002934F321|nr:NAD/FAD-utilizing enzyme [Teredinibacter sp. KSP-S5-2]WNO08416.1 NAD/FAD-utilizing enzyme [Teredinibacter sp. KSP-S5-2]
MKRLFFISSSLDDIDKAEHQLIDAGINGDRFHLLSSNESAAIARDLHAISSLAKTDVVHWMERGVLIGMAGVLIVLSSGYFSGLYESFTWAPFIFLSLVIFGFSCWEAGFVGIQKKNYKYARFDRELSKGNHIFMVDIEGGEKTYVKNVCEETYHMSSAGEDSPWASPFENTPAPNK